MNLRNFWENMTIEKHVEYYTNLGMSDMDAIKKVAVDRGVNKREIYAVVKKK